MMRRPGPLAFSGFIARAQCLHEAATQMIEAENPHAAFTLLRAYTGNTAAILYAKDHPNLLDHPSGSSASRASTTN
jgi:hypothetical protein